MKEQYIVYHEFSMKFTAFGSTYLTMRLYSCNDDWTGEVENASTFDTELDALKWIDFLSQSNGLKGAIFGIEKIYKYCE